MSAYILSNALVYLKDILPITAGVGATFRISPDLERGLDINTGGVNAFFVLKSSTQIERYLITAVGGVATIVKRGLEQDGITENANLKKSWGDGSVGYISVKPDDFIATGKLDTAGGLRTTMQTNSDKNAIFIAGRTKLPIINADFATGSGSTSTAAWIGTKSNGWYASGVGTWNASYDTGRLKLQTTAVSSYIEARTTDGGYNGITAESIPVEPNTTYTLEYDMETLYTSGSSTGGAKIAILFQTSAGVGDGEASPSFINTTTANTHYTATFTTGPNTRYCNISPVLYGHMGTGTLLMSAWFDNIVVSCPSKELLKTITQKASLSAEDEVFIENQDGTLSSVKYSVLQSDMALAGGGSYTATPYESTIVANDPVGITSDGLFKCTTENKSSINISASTVVMLGTVKLDATRTLFMYYSGLTVFARVGTLTIDTMAFGTEVTIGTGATGGIYGGCCEIGTNKVVTVWGDGTTASANNANHTVLTISGTTITVNTTYTYSMPNVGGAVKPIQTVCKVRNDCYAWGYFTVNVQNCFINSVSGTVITINGTAFISQTTGLSTFNGVYLSDNLIGFPVGGNGVATSMNMFAVTPGAVTIATTYTGASSDGTGTTTAYLARVSDTEYVATFAATNTNTVKYTKPPSGTALIVANIVANGAVGYPVVSVGDASFGVVNGTTLSVYTRSGQLLGTITGITSPAANSLFQYFKTSNARIIYITGTNGTVRIINLARVFYLGIANNSVGGVLFRGLLTVTGIVANQLYYVQADGTIGETFSGKLIGKGIATNTLLVG